MNHHNSFEINRREVLKGTAAASLSVAASTMTTSPTAAAPFDTAKSNSRIKHENEKAGASDWQLTRVRVNQGQYRTSLVEGYCSHQSIAAEETLRVFVSTQPARRFTVDIYRMGYFDEAIHETQTSQLTLGPGCPDVAIFVCRAKYRW